MYYCQIECLAWFEKIKGEHENVSFAQKLGKKNNFHKYK